MKKELVLKIEVYEKVDVVDVFISNKESDIELKNEFCAHFEVNLISDACVGWRATPVRGPNVSADYNYRNIDYAILA